MNIHSFEQEVNPTILGRGLDYYQGDCVADLFFTEDGEHYTGFVEGSRMYEVEVQLSGSGEIELSSCDCPFDMGPVCKHEVAVYYEILEKIGGGGKEGIQQKQDLRELLSGVKKDALIDLMLELAEADPALENRLYYKFSKHEEEAELDNCKRLMDSIIDKYSGRKGFIHYNEVWDFTSELSTIRDRIVAIQDPLLAADVALLLLDAAIEALTYADDSGGNIGFLASETINSLQRRSTDLTDFKDQDELIDKIFCYLENPQLNDWPDYKFDLLSVCMGYAGNAHLRQKLINKMEEMLEAGEDFSSTYTTGNLLNLIYMLIEQYEDREKAESFLIENVKYPSFRKRLISKHLEAGDYEKVLQLSREGEKQDQEKRGLLLVWKRWRYTAYKGLCNKAEQEKLGFELLMGGDFEYYWELKELYLEKGLDCYEQLKDRLKKENPRIYLQLIEAEEDKEAILEHARENPRDVERYLKYLMDYDKEEVLRLFAESIRLEADTASNRSRYREVCRTLQRFKKAAGHDRQKELVRELKERYNRRPAFLDELSKIKAGG